MENKSLYETHYEMLLVQLENLETDLEGYAGRNWQDEYKNYNNLSICTGGFYKCLLSFPWLTW
jgi:hypothetical protein